MIGFSGEPQSRTPCSCHPASETSSWPTRDDENEGLSGDVGGGGISGTISVGISGSALGGVGGSIGGGVGIYVGAMLAKQNSTK